VSPQLRPRLRRGALLTLVPLGLLVLGACSEEQKTQFKRLAQPVGASDRAPAMHSLWMWSWLAAILVGVLVWGLIFYASVRFRRRSDDEIPVQVRYNLPIEILYTIAPVVIVVVLFYHTVKTQDETLKPVAHPDHVVDVVGQQWSWTFNYVKDKDLNGSTTVWDAGTTAYEPTLVLPVNESVTFNLSSPDVIHSFWVPAFLFKMDVIPGRDNHFSLTPTRKGWYLGRCAELCGVYHSRMLFRLHVVDSAQYATYLQSLQAQGNTGLNLGGSHDRHQVGLHTNENGAGQ
jgi:cytochrome c oxidase subunit 2